MGLIESLNIKNKGIIFGVILAGLPLLITIMIMTRIISFEGSHGIAEHCILMFICSPLSFIAFLYNCILLALALVKRLGFRKVILIIIAIIISILPLIFLFEDIMDILNDVVFPRIRLLVWQL